MTGDGTHIPYGHQSIDDSDTDAVVAALRSGWLTTGPAVGRFEQALAGFCGAQDVVVVSSGTAALHAAYSVAGLAKGAELVTTPMTFAATAYLALHLGATVRFADILDADLTIDPQAVEGSITPATRVVTAVDMAGHPCRLDELMELTEAAGILLVEDAAQSLGSVYRGRAIGSIAPVTVFSFHPVKLITTGEGGAVALKDGGWGESLRRFRNHGLVKETTQLKRPAEGAWHQEVQSLGLNYRLSDVGAALGVSQLERASSFISRRRALVERYDRLLSGVEGIRLPVEAPDVVTAWHLYQVRILDGLRGRVYEALRLSGVGVQVHFLPVHRHPLFEELGYRAGSCPVAEQAYSELLSLPLYPDLTEAQQDRVVETLLRAVA